jgi:cation diffusion facilitator CzcD-associated flavoprotein CzcO
MRTKATMIDDIPGDLPTGAVPVDADYEKLADWTITCMNDRRNTCFNEGLVWRDLFALTNSFRTFVGRDTVLERLNDSWTRSQCGQIVRSDGTPRKATVTTRCSWLDVDAEFVLSKQGNSAKVRAIFSTIINDHGERQVWLIRTWLDHFEGHGHPDRPLSPFRTTKATSRDQDYDVVIIGGGQAGLSIAGRLQALGIHYIVLERNKALGDVWRSRYASLRWHTPKEYGNLPFGRMFADDTPELVPTRTIGDAHEAWAKRYEICSQTDCDVNTANFEHGVWSVMATVHGSSRVFRGKDLVLAIGPGSTHPSRPNWATPDAIKASGFSGVVVHAKDYDSCRKWAGRGDRGVTVGTANTGHDIAEDMANAGLHTTMLQRGRTFVMPGEWLCAAEGAHYNELVPNQIADQQQFTMPLKLARDIINTNVHARIKSDPERFDALERAGFRLDRFGDLYNNVFTRFGGHYVDTGASDRIAKGEILMESASVNRLCADGIELADARVLKCELIVLATGYKHDFRADAAKILGKAVADRMDDYFGLDPEGEIRGYAKYAGGKPTLILFARDDTD